MNGLMSVAVVAVSFGIMIGLAVVVTAATRTARKLLRRRWQATRAPVRRRGRGDDGEGEAREPERHLAPEAPLWPAG